MAWRITVVGLGLWAGVSVLAPGCRGPGPEAYDQACQGVVCGPGRCVLDVDRPACICDEGFTADALACVPDGSRPRGVCAPNPCNEPRRSQCREVAGAARCECDPDSYEVSGSCVPKTACSPNPCTGANQTTCSLVGGSAVCSCDPGYSPEGNGCGAEPVFSCADQHTGSLSDAFEPDECPSLAKELPLGTPDLQGHTIGPAADADWYRITPEVGHIYLVTASAAFALYADVYRSDGVTAIAADHRGTGSIAVRFKATSAEPRYVRIRALRANEVGSYTIAALDLGLDDFPDSPATALPIAVGSTLSGELQFDGDVDALRIEVSGGHAYEVDASWGGPLLQLQLVGADRTTLLRSAQGAPSAQIVTRPSSDGAIYVLVKSAQSAGIGTYSLQIQDLGPDDHGDVPPEATALTPSPSLWLGALERTGDVDVFSFNAQSGHIYSFICTVGTGYSYGCASQLIDANGAVFADSSGSNYYTTALFHEAVQSGKLYARVTVTRGSSAYLTYSFRLEDLGPDDHGDTPAAATAIALGSSGAGRLEINQDVDVFSFTATSGRIYRFKATSGPLSNVISARMLNSTGAVLATSDTSFSSSTVAYEATAGGTIYAEVKSLSSYGNSTSYAYVLDDLGPDDHGDSVAAATSIAANFSATTGSIETLGDVDVFRFIAVAGNVYRFTCTVSSYGACKPVMKNPAGVTVATSAYGGTYTSVVGHEAAVSGTHYVEVTFGSSYYGNTGTYTYRLDDLGPDDHGDSPATATSITPSANRSSANLEIHNDVDVFAFTAAAGRIYRFTCAGGTSSQPFALRVLNSMSVDLKAWTTAGSGYATSIVGYEPATTGTYYVEISGGNYYAVAGPYTYTLEDLGPDDHGDTLATATALTPPASGQAALELGNDTDVFSFTAAAGNLYRFTCTPGTLSSCGLRLKDSFGTVLATGGGYSSIVAAFTAPASGVYYAEVSTSYFGTGGNYTYRVDDVGTDDHGDSYTSATPLMGLSAFASGTIEYAGDRDYFSISLGAGESHTVVSSGVYIYVTVYGTSGVTQVAPVGSPPLSFITTGAGTYYLQVVSYGGGTGAYQIAVQ
ncbi:MAG: pre-peptidase C-terminal domain-containing protein [Myxococcales bacterium]|nr:pre-peptidase C-terminal domain-containing protein [Myxococcales bacterium]